MKSSSLKLTSSAFCFKPKIIISFIMFVRKFVFYFTTLPLHPHTPHAYTQKQKNKPEIRVFELGYKLYFFLKILKIMNFPSILILSINYFYLFCHLYLNMY